MEKQTIIVDINGDTTVTYKNLLVESLEEYMTRSIIDSDGYNSESEYLNDIYVNYYVKEILNLFECSEVNDIYKKINKKSKIIQLKSVVEYNYFDGSTGNDFGNMRLTIDSTHIVKEKLEYYSYSQNNDNFFNYANSFKNGYFLIIHDVVQGGFGSKAGTNIIIIYN